MENRAHQEPYDSRLKRFNDSPPNEIIQTLLFSIEIHFNNEIKATVEGENHQTILAFLGIHAVALTIAEGLFNKKGDKGYKLFLEKYVDGPTDHTKFSVIAKNIHELRNTFAHQWLGASGHTIGFDYNMPEGWKEKEGRIFINPRIYVEYYLKAFSFDKLYKIKTLPEEKKEMIKRRLLKKFTEIPEVAEVLIEKQRIIDLKR